jgi:2-amino-4-hydroxy-6-hydroxymethyldihydropteridine diphosphokinase
MRAGIALGSNLGDRLANLQAARDRIRDLPGVRAPVLTSAIYETEAVDCEPAAGKFLNAVIEFEFSGTAPDLLLQLCELEKSLGRPAAHLRNTSRTIDLDLLYLGGTEIDFPALVLPHPRMHERRFVLEPLADLRPDLVLPRQTETVAALLQRLAKTPPLVWAASEW